MSPLPCSITYKPSAAKALRKLDRQYQQAIITAIDALAHEPRPDGVKKLQGGDGEYRIRVGAHRVAYEVNDEELIILVLHLGHREAVYRAL
ncbi:type II toxin-antitoxin system RelE family toxin [Corynebacterium sp. A21]|uniref:type II toxin-antitoxin system RelE family toxin n=1 Tax=Corynebacterium sp. A21 TaxID=3457318 RepID=UPI003FD5454C